MRKIFIFSSTLLLFLFLGNQLITDNTGNSKELPSSKSEINLIFFGIGNYATFYGGVMGDEWYSPEFVLEKLDNSVEVNFYAMDGELGKLFFTDSLLMYDEYCDCPDYYVDLDIDGYQIIGITGKWDPFAPELIFPEDPTPYNNSVKEFLVTYGIENPVYSFENYIESDFTGDGKRDAVVDVVHDEYNEYGITQRGSLSVVLLISDIEGEQEIIPIFDRVYLEDGTDEMDLLFNNEIEFIADLNGDGVYELIISDGYYEGSNSSIYTFKDNVFFGQIGCGCGG
ncbi:MAG: hypothetical protein K9J16_14650 [Melioribacteraceae bacterium]|nr:hypothetical protein [Melioribacteraceae bacterium]MCF8356360.1 hypothetical protein [Melioribacteraceae bacterium]MCF8395799.1 hypothetical protein [Melioribacteraceae bacterium]MCF8420664.1 hypothetical protein [Melioribacteraceae bacterium]